jgi:hypothetical protein
MNCKPGDKAFAISSLDGSNNGKLFRVIDAAGWYSFPGDLAKLFCWNVEALCTVTIFETFGTRIVPAGDIGIFPDKYLRPLPGEHEIDATEESTTQTRELEEQ